MMSNHERLAYMAAQIARNFAALGEEAAVKATAEHIRLFWDPRMRAGLAEALATGEVQLEPLARRAFESVEAR